MEVLDNRLAERVNEMMEMGLIEELLEFHKQYNVQRLAHNFQADYSRGVFQSIGLKEFHSYLMLNEEQRNSDIGKKLLDEGIKALVQANTQYSRYQTRYMLNKYIKVPESKKVPPVFKLDTTNLSKWEEQVESKAISIVESYLNGSDMLTLKYTPMAKEEPDSKRFEAGQFYCDSCNRLFIGAYQWEAHYRSKPHRKALYKRKVNDLKMKLKNLKQHVNAGTAAGEDDEKLRTNGAE